MASHSPRSFSLNNTGRLPVSCGAWVVFSLFLLVGIAILDDYGVSGDASVQRLHAEENLDYILGDRDAISATEYKFYGVAFDLPLLLVERALGLEDTRTIYLSRHLLIHLFFLLGAACCYLLAVRLFNNRLLALAAMLLFLLHPRLYAHSFFNSKDIPFFSMFMITLFLIHRAFALNTVRAFLLCGAAVAVLINLRVMGVMLLIAVVGMRGLDAWYAEGKQERIRVLKTLVSFVGGGVLTLYAIWPYLWEDPLGRLAEALAIASRHPFHIPIVFKGASFDNTNLPWDYLPTWFLITTPWVALLLGLIGIVLVLGRGILRPRDIVRNTPLRFQWLLLACFILPILAVIVLKPTLFQGWRHMYFLYAPFCLLAAFGLYQLVSLSKKKHWRVGVYALAGVGLGIVVIEMAQIHPYQHLYFNALVDRHTPEYLSTQYRMGASLSTKGLRSLLERYPSPSPIYVNTLPSRWKLLAAPERQRFVSNPARADVYFVRHYRQRAWQERRLPKALEPLYTVKVYNNTILTVRNINLDSQEVSVQAFYRDTYRKVKTGEPVTRSVFDVYVDRDKLVYVKESCSGKDLWRRFSVHVLPVNEGDLPDGSKPHGFENLDFSLSMYGVRFDGKCMAIVPLPEYEIDLIRTGQFLRDKPAWEATLLPQRKQQQLTARLAEVPQAIASGTPLIKAVFDVYWYRGGGELPHHDSAVEFRHQDTLVYVRESCTESDTEARFLLHIFPKNRDELPPSRRVHGFDNRDFVFSKHGMRMDGRCMVVVPLPEYDVAKVRTGQFTNEGVVWEGKFSLKQN